MNIQDIRIEDINGNWKVNIGHSISAEYRFASTVVTRHIPGQILNTDTFQLHKTANGSRLIAGSDILDFECLTEKFMICRKTEDNTYFLFVRTEKK
jgi:hypothetical protein